MAISMDLRVLARKLEKSSDDLLVKASTKSPEVFEKVATAIAAASTLLEKVADDMDQDGDLNITPEQLDEMAAIAAAFDESGDPLLQKQASVLDEILLSIAAPKNAALQARKVTEDEINRLREERRRARGEEAYVKPRQEHHDMWNSAAQAKAVEQQVKRYVPLEAPLQTRYPPDRPGGQMTRITDHVYQDIVTGIIYDYKAGYTTQKGNKIPGGSVENQTRQLGDYRNQGSSLFETRESLMGRYASGGDLHHLKKYALSDQITEALRAVRDGAPELVNDAIDHANEDGLSTTEVANILSDEIKATGSLEDCLVAAGWDDLLPKGRPDPSLNRESIVALALNAIQELAPHLLKSAVAKARKEGLSDEQVKSVLAGGFYSNFDVPFGEEGEIKAAESLFPHLKALGWGDLIDQHLQVMAKLGVNKKAIQNLSGKKVSGSHRQLSSILKRAVAAKPAPDWSMFGTEGEPTADVLNPEAEEEAPPTIPQMPEGMEEEAPPSLFTEMFGEPEAKGPITPKDDLEEWNRVYESVKNTVSGNPDIRRQITDMRQSGQKDEADQLLKKLFNDEMNKQGFAGAFERDENDDEYHIVAKELMRLAPKAPAPPAPEPAPAPEPESEKIVSEEGEPATDEGKVLPWEKYQADNNVVVSDTKAAELEGNMLRYYNSVKDGFDAIFKRYTFPGSTIPQSVEKLPKNVKDNILPMYMRGENTEAVYSAVRGLLSDSLMPEAQEAAQEQIAGMQVKADRLLQEAFALDEEGESTGGEEGAKKKKMSETRLEEYQKLEDQLANPDNIVNRILSRSVEDRMPAPADLKKARDALRGAENKAMAQQLRSKAVSNARRAAINLFLKADGLPPMYPEGELLTKTDFVKQLSELGVSDEEATEQKARRKIENKKKKSILVHPIPQNEEDQRLIPVWEAPEQYIEALMMAKAVHPAPDYPRGRVSREMKKGYQERMKEVKAKWDALMKEQGFVPPSYKLFGATGSTLSMLRGLKLEDVSNPLPDFGGLKNLFENPDEYAAHYQAGADKFVKQYDRRRPPKEFDEIHGGVPELTGIPTSTQGDIRALYENGEEFKDAVEAMQKLGVKPSVVKKVWDTLDNSGKKVRGMILARINKGEDPEAIEERVLQYYPDAHIPEGVIEFMYNMKTEQSMHNKDINTKWNDWSKNQGFYPPHLATIGKVTSHDLLKPWSYRDPDPDRFGGTPMAMM